MLAAVVASGVVGPRWSFEGFLPRTGRDRRDRLARIAADERATVVYEAPNRVAATLRDLAAACGVDRPGAVCRELTKVHETVTRASLGALAEMATAGEIPPRGEFVLVVGQRTGPADSVRRPRRPTRRSPRPAERSSGWWRRAWRAATRRARSRRRPASRGAASMRQGRSIRIRP